MNNLNKKIVVFLAMTLCSGVPARAFETSSANFVIDMVSLPNGDGPAASSNSALSFSVIGEGLGSLQLHSSNSFSLAIGQAALLSWAGFLNPEQNWMISDVLARTDLLGDLIPAATWQKDDSPYFSWAILIDPPSLVKGFSISLDAVTDDSIDTEETYFQYPDKTIMSGRHVFHVTPVDLLGFAQTAGTKSFEIWVDSTAPSVGQCLPAAGSLLAVNQQAITCHAVDFDSGINAGFTQLTLNGDALAFTYDAASGVIQTSAETILAEGTNAVLVKVSDNVGNTINQAWDFVVDTYPPQGTMLINNGAQIAHSAYVTLDLSAKDSISGTAFVFISNDGVFDTEYNSPRAYAPIIENWLLAEPDVDGAKTVYVKFRDRAGNLSPTYSAGITLRRLVPDTRIISGPSAVTPETAADIRFEATRPGCVFSYSIDNQPWTAWSSVSRVRADGFKEGNHYFSAKGAFDANGDGLITPDEEDATPAQWIWTVKAEGVLEQLKEKILFWRR